MDFAEIRAAAREAGIDTERRLLAEVLGRHGFRLTWAARELGCGVSTLQRALGRHPELRAQVPGPGAPPKRKQNNRR